MMMMKQKGVSVQRVQIGLEGDRMEVEGVLDHQKSRRNLDLKSNHSYCNREQGLSRRETHKFTKSRRKLEYNSRSLEYN